MPMTPALDDGRPRAWLARLRTGGAGALSWTPVWIPLLFLGQLLWFGFAPARAEAARLDQAEVEVRSRATDLLDEEAALAREARMLADPVYQERVRRSLLVPSGEPLRLERSRSGRQP
jgi:hypothetical protein